MTQRSILDTASRWDLRPVRHFLSQSDPRQAFLASRQINGTVAGARTRRTLALGWDRVSPAVGQDVQAHYDANAHGAFQVNPPGSGAAVDAIYLRPPRLRHLTAAAVDITVELEEALATD